MWGGVWGGGEYEAVAALCLWLSKLRACRGWLAGWLPEKLVGMQGQGRGRRLLPSLLTNKPMFVFVYLKASSKANSDAKLLLTALLSFEETGGISAACCSAQGCSWVSGLAGKLNGQRLIKTGDAPPPLFPTRHLKPSSLPPSLAPSPTPAVEYIQGPCSRLFIFSYLSFSPVHCFCLSDGSHCFIFRMASLPRLPASLWTEGHAVYDRNNMQTDRKINHMWPHMDCHRGCRISCQPELRWPLWNGLFFILHSHTS